MSGETDCTAFPLGDNLFEWAGTITGSVDTVVCSLHYISKILFALTSYVIWAEHLTYKIFFAASMKTCSLRSP